jgi:integral membrane sensor domain MASE1
LWPPNALLTAALLLTPTKRWWLVLLAALPAHLALELRNWSTVVVTGLFATNCSEALLAAGGVRLLSREPFTLGTLRQMAIFVGVGALFAPLVSSFPDAAIVSTFHNEGYWDVWIRRAFSNVLSEIAVVPAVMGAISAAGSSLSHWRGRRWMEAGVLFAGLVAATLLVSGHTGFRPWHPPLPLAVFLPFLLWAALRFGPEGVALSLLATAGLTLGAATHGIGPFGQQSADQGVQTLQIFLIVVAIPLMCVAAIDQERRRAEHALADRLQFEEVLWQMSAAFGSLPCEEIPRASSERLEFRLRLERHHAALQYRALIAGRVKAEGPRPSLRRKPAAADRDRETLARHGLASAISCRSQAAATWTG